MGQGWGPPWGNKWGLLVTWEKSGTPKESLKIKNDQGKLKGGANANLPGITPSTATPRADLEPHSGRWPVTT